MPVHGGPAEKFDIISYTPSLKDSGNLAAGPITVNVTAEPVGLGSAQANSIQTLAVPTDARLTITRLAFRLALTNTLPALDTDLFCRIYIDLQDANHRLLDLHYTTAAAQLSVAEANPTTPSAAAWTLLTDGNAHTYYVFMWKTGTGTGPVVSLCELYFGVGTTGAAGSNGSDYLKLTHTGDVQVGGYPQRNGTGTFFPTIQVAQAAYAAQYEMILQSAVSTPFLETTLGNSARVYSPGGLWWRVRTLTVATDIVVIAVLGLVLRSYY